jgi:hypothetical protein
MTAKEATGAQAPDRTVPDAPDAPGAPDQRRAAWLGAFLALIVALPPRLWFALDEHPARFYLVGDMALYAQRAGRLHRGVSGAEDTFTPVGYPAALALLEQVAGPDLAGVGVAHAVLSAATCSLAVLLGFELTREAGRGLVAGLVLAGYFPLIFYTGLLLTETLFSFLLVLSALLLARAVAGRGGLAAACLAGAGLGAAAAVRPNLLLFFPLLVVLVAFVFRAAPVARRAGAAALASALPVLLAVCAYNSVLLGRPAGLATNGGVNFLLAHCDCRAVSLPPGGRIAEISSNRNRRYHKETLVASRPEYDEAYFYREGLRQIAERPARLAHGLQNLVEGLGLGEMGTYPRQAYWPSYPGHDVLMNGFGRAAFWLGVLPVALHTVVLARARSLGVAEQSGRLVLLALLASVLLALLLFIGDPRVRVSFDPLLIVLAVDAGWALALGAAEAARKRALP